MLEHLKVVFNAAFSVHNDDDVRDQDSHNHLFISYPVTFAFAHSLEKAGFFLKLASLSLLGAISTGS
jgi:hypothetical protein